MSGTAGDIENGLHALLWLLVLQEMARRADGSVFNTLATGHLLSIAQGGIENEYSIAHLVNVSY